MCDPSEAFLFMKHKNEVPEEACKRCLPDCNAFFYGATVTSLPFRQCSDKNIGASPLCKLNEPTPLKPVIYGSLLRQEYLGDSATTADDDTTSNEDEDADSELPDHVRERENNIRTAYSDERALFQKSDEKTYDAYVEAGEISLQRSKIIMQLRHVPTTTCHYRTLP